MNRKITYCSNIHPGESWHDVMHNLNSHTVAVKNNINQDLKKNSFPLGLRVSNRAATQITDTDVKNFHTWCDINNCYLLTINGFPYGEFHNNNVKEKVYLPDWRSYERVAYTKRLADIAVQLSSMHKKIPISTVPIAFKKGFNLKKESQDWQEANRNITIVAEYFYKIYNTTGITLQLAIEPEPCCVLETTEETIDFFNQLNIKDHLKPFVGICFDCCHQAVEFEEPKECLQKLSHAKIPIFKVQVSSALKAENKDIHNILQFDETTYLHQVVALLKNKSLLRFNDLPDFKQSISNDNIKNSILECRVHFHIPIFADTLDICDTTQFFIRDFLPLLPNDIPIEIETYSFGVLPKQYQNDSISESITRELQWAYKLINRR